VERSDEGLVGEERLKSSRERFKPAFLQVIHVHLNLALDDFGCCVIVVAFLNLEQQQQIDCISCFESLTGRNKLKEYGELKESFELRA
jgi:hypothetical protein